MYTAALDTSGHYASFSLEENNTREIICENHTTPMGKESSKLVSCIVDMVAKHGISFGQIKTWVVGLGPGSYTGLRIGIAYAKGVCLATGSSLKGYPSSMAMALAVDSKQNDRLGVLHDGRRKTLIVSPYLRNHNTVAPQSDPKIVEIDKIFGEKIDQFIILKDDYALLESINQTLPMIAVDQINSTKLLEIEKLNRECNNSIIGESLQPIYVRPPVFVNPNKVLNIEPNQRIFSD